MDSIRKEDIILPDYETLMGCIYENYLNDTGQEFDYENYGKALDKIGQIASNQDYNYLEDTITDACQNSARHGFLMGARMTMVLLFGWQQGNPRRAAGFLKQPWNCKSNRFHERRKQQWKIWDTMT